MKKQHAFALSALAAVLIAGCASSPSTADLDKLTADIVKASFSDKGIVKVAVIAPEEINIACSAAEVAGKPLNADVAEALQAAQLKTIKWPTDGNYMGDWKAGEKLAQSGRGLTWTDAADTPNGGNCYNCHQMDPKEISFGTIGPSLTGYAKTRGVIADPTSPASKAIIEYTWGKIWNAKAYSACSVMPRAGHKGIMTEAQVKDLMALLLDPKSPVNQ
ncbi:MAG: sulfur oxidation c-type cytochrome SoxX [Rhodoferax sp.]|uniref:sulfur oxidation c-type cytochrome SoxX n=1 Tax=Rhodoferax sp. TaxID=50421 RepID=UPI002635EAB9|nr:sulfur oxidation c-type cytochrome SoxX [Rhodoferax sp.]MDD2880265.1 sulfur oxidation c-type cytochrome SoxX [Rhodoferax sp.]